MSYFFSLGACSEYVGIHFEERHPHKCVVMRFLEDTEKNLLLRLGLLWQRNWLELLCRSPNTMLPFVAWRQWAAAGERDTQPEPDTGSSESNTKQTAELWHFPLQKDYLHCH